MKFTGLIALALFTTAFVLAVRRPTVHRRFASLAQQYRIHHFVALASVVATITHVLLQFAALPREDWGIYLDFGDFANAAAWGGLILLLLGVAASLHTFKHYKIWYMLHLVLIPAFLLSAWHGVLMAGRNAPVFYLLVTLCATTGITLIAMWADKRATTASACHITAIRKLAPGISELHLSLPLARAKSGFKAGSVVFLRFARPGMSHMWHPFSVASCRSEHDLRLLIKGFGADTRQVAQLAVGDTVHVHGPYREVMPDFQKPQVWIAGGVGIAAFAGFWACLREGAGASVDIWHFVRDASETITAADLGLVPSKANSMRMHSVIEKSDELAGLQGLVSRLQDRAGTQFFVSGPPAFMRKVRRKIQRDGISRSQIHTEEFTPW